MRFRNRREAGRALARDLAELAPERPVVVALPRGGVPVAYEIARALAAPLEVLAVRKLGAPTNPEYGVGAVVEDGTAVLDRNAALGVGMSREVLAGTVQREIAELARRVARYRSGRPMMPVTGRTVVLVDDGIATGVTDLAAVRALRKLSPRKIILAVPVGAPDSLRQLAAEADEVVCPHVPHAFGGVGRWYEDFSEVTDAEVVALLGGAREPAPPDGAHRREFTFEIEGRRLGATLILPAGGARALVVFAHGSGSSRHSPRNVAVAEALAEAGFASVLMDLLTEAEASDRPNVFNTHLLADRLVDLTRWARSQPGLRNLPIGYFGASTGAAAALRAAARLGPEVRAVVSRGGRPDLAEDELPGVTAPTLLIVGGDDWNVLELNDEAATLLRCTKDLAIVPHAGHLFEEPGALEHVARLAIEWFERHLAATEHAVGDAA
jgi:predicted phosphoribosyltransferase/pimeloyl-ACP methyl ester carboxylesterase